MSRGCTPASTSARRASFTVTGAAGRPASANRRAAGVARVRASQLRGDSSATTRPARSSSTRSAAGRQRSSRCSASTIAVPHSSFSRRSTPSSSSPATGSSCEVGSSSSSNRGRPASAAASATRCSSPPDSSCVGRSSRPPSPSASAASSTPRATAGAGQPRFSSGKASSDRTLPITTCVSGSWNSVPATAASRAGPCSRVSIPPHCTRPANVPPWKCGTNPHAASSSVDLPEPDPPARSTSSPGSTANDTSSSAAASTPGYR